jgi:hypothetical protein
VFPILDRSMSSPEWNRTHVDEMRAYRRKHYQEHKVTVVDRVTERKKRIAVWFQDQKTGKQCLMCPEENPETDPACLDYHHREGEHKVLDVSVMVRRGFTESRILEEIAKCDLICSNCHRKHHARLRTSRKHV